MTRVHKADTILAMSAGMITYSWVADATEIATLVAAVFGAVAAAVGSWYHVERAMKLRKERKDADQKGRHSYRASLHNGDGDSVGSDAAKRDNVDAGGDSDA